MNTARCVKCRMEFRYKYVPDESNTSPLCTPPAPAKCGRCKLNRRVAKCSRCGKTGHSVKLHYEVAPHHIIESDTIEKTPILSPIEKPRVPMPFWDRIRVSIVTHSSKISRLQIEEQRVGNKRVTLHRIHSLTTRNPEDVASEVKQFIEEDSKYYSLDTVSRYFVTLFAEDDSRLGPTILIDRKKRFS